MSEVEASCVVEASLAEAWATYFDPERWIEWVDGFAGVSSISGYPDVGGTLVWRSTPAGRGQVCERVLLHEPRRLHRIEFSDPESSGTLETAFAMLSAVPGGGQRTEVRQTLEYRLAGGGPLRGLTDFLFIRSQMRRSLQRSLGSFAAVLPGTDRKPLSK